MDTLNQTAPYNLFGIEDTDYKSSKIIVLPIPYDSTTSYKTGTRDGPRAIIDASRYLEPYNEELNTDISKIGIFTMKEMMPNVSSPEAMAKEIRKEVSVILNDSKIPLLLGGDHSISIGALAAVAESGKEFSVLHFDAHSDSRDSFMGSKYSHASVMARAREVCDRCYSVGVRSINKEGMEKHSGDILFRKDMHGKSLGEIVDIISSKIKKDVYLTIDFDVLDPSEMPSVGTPEPDGLKFYELIFIIKEIFKHKNIIGLDFTELAPIPGMIAPNYLAAKLIYLILGYALLK